MFEYIKYIFTKPQLELSYTEYLVMCLVIVLAMIFIVAIIYLTIRILEHISNKKSRKCKNWEYDCEHKYCFCCKNYKKKNKE